MKIRLYIFILTLIVCNPACKLKQGKSKITNQLNAFSDLVEPNIWQAIGPFGAGSPMAIKNEWSPFGSGRFECLDVNLDNENEILAGHATSGLFKTIDGGLTWAQKLNFDFATGIFNILRFKKNDKHLLACCCTDMGMEKQYGYGLIESFDNGETWQRNSLQFNPSEYNYQQQRAVAIIDKRNEQSLVSISNHEIYISTDGAKTWTSVFKTTENLINIKVNPQNEQQIIVTGNAVIVSYDGGLSWLDETASIARSYGSVPGKNARYEVCYSEKKDKKLYIAVSHNNSYILQANPNALREILLISKSEFIPNIYHMCFGKAFEDNTGNENLLVGTTRVFNSQSGGSSFNQLTVPNYLAPNNAHDDVNAIQIMENAHLFIATDGGIDKSIDGGMTWKSLTNSSLNLNASLIFGFDKAKNNVIMAGTQDKGILLFKRRKWWTCDLYGDGGRVVTMGDSLAFACGYSKMCYVTKDEGKTMNYNHAGADINFFDFRMQYAPEFNTLYIANQHLYKQPEGKHFEILSGDLSTERPIGAFWVNNENTDQIWLSKMDATWGGPLIKKLYYTDDGGANWQDKTAVLPILNWRSITDIDVNQRGEIAITLNGFDNAKSTELNKVYLSKDGGNSFQNISEGLSNHPVYTIEPVGDDWVCGTANGIYIKNGSQNWIVLGKGFPKTIVSEIKYYANQNMLYASTLGRGMWRIWLN
ncbi:MAG: hypothetical protein PSX81_04995 [bacterium]|nr:hypothetical protein [bacterium]